MFFIYNTPLEDDLRTPLTNSGCTRLQRPFKGYRYTVAEGIDNIRWVAEDTEYANVLEVL
jgi:hypothetical protein